MLKGVPDIIRADLLHLLASMGHGDEIAIVDRNYPAASSGRPVVCLEGVDICAAGRAILQLLPLDDVTATPIVRMEVTGAASELPDVQKAFLAMAEEVVGTELVVGQLARLDFYDRVRHAFAVVSTGEARPFGCFILVAGVI